MSHGKLFLVETEPLEGQEVRRTRWRGRSTHRIEYYWLCDECAFVLTLSYEKGQGVVAVPRPDFAKKKPAAAVRTEEMPEGRSIRREQSPQEGR
jgi:hypothetical protein